MNPETFADLLLASHPAAWPGRREEARAIFAGWLQPSTDGTCLVVLPAWLTSELPKIKAFPPE